MLTEGCAVLLWVCRWFWRVCPGASGEIVELLGGDLEVALVVQVTTHGSLSDKTFIYNKTPKFRRSCTLWRYTVNHSYLGRHAFGI